MPIIFLKDQEIISQKRNTDSHDSFESVRKSAEKNNKNINNDTGINNNNHHEKNKLNSKSRYLSDMMKKED